MRCRGGIPATRPWTGRAVRRGCRGTDSTADSHPPHAARSRACSGANPRPPRETRAAGPDDGAIRTRSAGTGRGSCRRAGASPCRPVVSRAVVATRAAAGPVRRVRPARWSVGAGTPRSDAKDFGQFSAWSMSRRVELPARHRVLGRPGSAARLRTAVPARDASARCRARPRRRGTAWPAARGPCGTAWPCGAVSAGDTSGKLPGWPRQLSAARRRTAVPAARAPATAPTPAAAGMPIRAALRPVR